MIRGKDEEEQDDDETILCDGQEMMIGGFGDDQCSKLT